MQIDEKMTIKDALTNLLKKYGIPSPFKFQLHEVANEEGELSLLPGWQFINMPLNHQQIPLLTWRIKRPFVELKSIVDKGIIENVRLVRFCAFTNPNWSLKALLYREIDLVEYITGHKITSLNAVLGDEKAGNIIARLENGTLCSIEISIQLPLGSPCLERHELIAQRGIASDLLVDSQVPQSSIYSYTEEGEQRFKDYDMELFGYEDHEIDHIRAAFEVISKPSLIEQWLVQHRRLQNLIEQAFVSEKNRQKINITTNTL